MPLALAVNEKESNLFGPSCRIGHNPASTVIWNAASQIGEAGQCT